MDQHNPQWSYSSHQENELSLVKDLKLPSCYSNPKSIDSWIHNRMFLTIDPLIHHFPQATWITIGDGKYGTDAYYLETKGLNVLATSLTDATLVIANQKGYIKNFRAENAEKISAPNNSFDFVLCKESYHHFPRPSVAFYEMLRIAKKAVILIEPIEEKKILDNLKTIIKKTIRRDKSTLFEPSGNFIYRINISEIEKMLTALNYHSFAVKKFNFFYHPKISCQKYRDFSIATIFTKLGIVVQDILSFLRVLSYGVAAIIIFKETPSKNLINEMQKKGFYFVTLPTNPYLVSGAKRDQ